MLNLTRLEKDFLRRILTTVPLNGNIEQLQEPLMLINSILKKLEMEKENGREEKEKMDTRNALEEGRIHEES